jgi:hypothetical protein
MRPNDVHPGGIRGVAPGQHSAAAARDAGIRRISKFTWRAGAAGVACSALIAVAFGHHAAAAQQPKTGSGGNSGQGTIVVPAQPPAPAQGAGQVTSGAS